MTKPISSKWVELSIRAPSEYVEPLSRLFHRYGKGGVATEEPGGYNPDEGEYPPVPDLVIVKTYYPLDDMAEGRFEHIDVGIKLMSQLTSMSPLTQRVIEEREWEESWKEYFHPLRVTKNLVIVPSWRSFNASKDDIVIKLDPGMAFGTGHHPTTRMCLEQIELMVKPGISLLDVGCGSGILSIAAAKLGASRVFGMEIDHTAASVAESNSIDNEVSDTVRVIHGTLPHPDIFPRSYDLVLANISAIVIVQLTKLLVTAVRPGGLLMVSGFLEKNEDEVSETIAEAGGSVEGRWVDGDWVTLTARINHIVPPVKEL